MLFSSYSHEIPDDRLSISARRDAEVVIPGHLDTGDLGTVLLEHKVFDGIVVTHLGDTVLGNVPNDNVPNVAAADEASAAMVDLDSCQRAAICFVHHEPCLA